MFRWSLFDDVFSPLLSEKPLDVFEDEKAFRIEVDLPGVELSDIDIGVTADKLSIKAERKWGKSGKAAFHKSFSESFILPPSVDSSGISATLSNGVLKVEIPKRAAPSSRKIEVKAQ